MKDMRRRVAEQAPEFYRVARGEGSPPLAAVLTADGRAGRQTARGIEWVTLIDEREREQIYALAREAAHDGVGTFSTQDADGTTLSGVIDPRGSGQIRLALPPSRRLSASDFQDALPEPMFAYLRALVRIGENVWIVGDTGFEVDLGASLVPDEHTYLVRSQAARPVPFGASDLDPRSSLQDALTARTLGGFDTLVYDGTLDAQTLQIVAARDGVVLTQRANAIDRALGRAGILAQRESALELTSFGAIVWVGRSRTGGMLVRQIAECQPAGEGVAYTPIAARQGDNARWLLPVSEPTRLMRLLETGQEDIVRAFAAVLGARHTEEDDARDRGEVVIEEEEEELLDDDDVPGRLDLDDDEPDDDDGDAEESEELGEIDHDDPGWELDAKAGGSPKADPGLVAAPGRAGQDGMFRARPVVRPSTRPPEPEPGTLTLDIPRRKVMIPEAPSGSAAKRTFAEILKERHRFPPVSENGPTLTPPVLRDENGRLPGDEPDEDITP